MKPFYTIVILLLNFTKYIKTNISSNPKYSDVRRIILNQKCIPWRLRFLISENAPIIYCFMRSIVAGNPNNQNHWNEEYRKSWDSPKRMCPNKDRLILEHISKEDKIVDIGCGNGNTLRYLKKLDFTNLYGVEASHYACKRLSSEGIKMVYSILPKINLMDNSFDLVILSQVLEHMVRRKKLLKEIVRILAPGGKAIITVPNDRLGPLDEKEHVRKYTTDNLNKLLSKFFAVIELKTFQDESRNNPTIFAVVQK